MNRSLVAFAATVALAGSLAACGGGGSGLDRDELVAKGDAICQTGHELLNEKATAEFRTTPTRAAMVKFIRTVAVPAYQDQLSKLQALDPDEESRAGWDEMTGKLNQGIERMKANPGLTLKPDSSPLEEASQAARDFGMKVCGKSD